MCERKLSTLFEVGGCVTGDLLLKHNLSTQFHYLLIYMIAFTLLFVSLNNRLHRSITDGLYVNTIQEQSS